MEKNVQILKYLMEYGTISEINNVFISIALFSIDYENYECLKEI